MAMHFCDCNVPLKINIASNKAGNKSHAINHRSRGLSRLLTFLNDL
jgi:hypothetical protein